MKSGASAEPEDREDGDDYLCLGVCQPDEGAAFCIGCGRPWYLRTAPEWDTLTMPSPNASGEDDTPDAAA